MKILITGSNGQLGFELQRSLPSHTHTLMTVEREQLDITNNTQVLAFFTEHAPDIIINAAAYTAVDKAEEEKSLAWSVNQQGAKNLALAAKKHSAKMIQISTDFVFSGEQSHPYTPEDKAKPLSVYGASKNAGDQAVLDILTNNALVIRTSWLYSTHGNNFVKTMLRLMRERDTLRIVADQIGTPTWAATLADCVWKLIDTEAAGIYHCANNGVASWYDFAIAIQEESLQNEWLDKEKPLLITAIRTQDYPTPATRPAYSVMDKTKIEKELNISLPHWRVSLRKMLKELK